MTGLTRPGSRGLRSWLGAVVGWLVLLILGLVVLATIAVPRAAGATPYTVLSSSMEPTLPPGTLLIVRPMPADRLAIGDVITYQLRPGRPEVVSHRITAIGYAADGVLTFRTRGDHNAQGDPDPVRAVQVRGQVWYAVPYVGHLTLWLGGRTRIVVSAAVAALLVGYALVLFAAGLRDRRRTPGARRQVTAP